MAVAQQEIEQAKALVQQGNSKAAVALLSQLIQRDASNVAAWLALSDVVDDPERAEYCLQKVLSLDPGNAAATEKLSNIKGGSLSVGVVGGLNRSDSVSLDDPEVAAHNEAPQDAESDDMDRAESVPQAISEELEQQDEMFAPESPAEASNADEIGTQGSQADEAQLTAASTTTDEPAQARATVGRTDLILIGLTVLAGLVLCALVSAALIS